MKVKKSTAFALEKAAKAASRSKASVVEFVLEEWLRESGYLKRPVSNSSTKTAAAPRAAAEGGAEGE